MSDNSPLQPAICTELALDEYLWEGEANGCPVSVIVTNPDIVLFVRALLTADTIGAQLVDQDGAVYDHYMTHRDLGVIQMGA
jgi:hypothetical protein